MHKKNYFAGLILKILLIVILLSGSVWIANLAYKNDYTDLSGPILTTHSPAPTYSANQPGWIVYNNTDYHFTIEYPQTFSLIGLNQPSDLPLGTTVAVIESNTEEGRKGVPTFHISVYVSDNPNNLTLNQWTDNTPHARTAEIAFKFIKSNRIVQNTTVNGYPALLESYNSEPFEGFEGGHHVDNMTKKLIIKRDNYIFTVKAFLPITLQEKHENDLDQILSTFKFLE